MTRSPTPDQRRAALAAAERPALSRRWRGTLRAATRFGLLLGGVSALRALAARFAGPAGEEPPPWWWVPASFAAGFAVFFVLTLVVVAAGGRTRPDGEVVVSPWFAWLLAGGLVAFVLGAAARGSEVAGLVAVGAWAIAVGAAWLGWRRLRA